MNRLVSVRQKELRDFCERHGITRLAIFGSALREDFGPDSDVDVMVDFAPTRTPGMIRLTGMKLELERLFGRDVGLVTRNEVEGSRNYVRRRSILDSAEVVYAERVEIRSVPPRRHSD